MFAGLPVTKSILLNVSFLPVVVLFLNLTTHAQIDQKKLDSLSRSIDSSSKAFRNWQDSFTKIQDSIYQTATAKSVENNSNNPSQFLAGEREKDMKRQRTLLRISAGVVVVLIVVIAWLLKRRTKT